MIIVAGTEEILHLVGVQSFIHRDSEDILYGRFVEYREIRFVFRFQFVAHSLELVTIVDDCFPGI